MFKIEQIDTLRSEHANLWTGRVGIGDAANAGELLKVGERPRLVGRTGDGHLEPAPSGSVNAAV